MAGSSQRVQMMRGEPRRAAIGSSLAPSPPPGEFRDVGNQVTFQPLLASTKTALLRTVSADPVTNTLPCQTLAQRSRTRSPSPTIGTPRGHHIILTPRDSSPWPSVGSSVTAAVPTATLLFPQPAVVQAMPRVGTSTRWPMPVAEPTRMPMPSVSALSVATPASATPSPGSSISVAAARPQPSRLVAGNTSFSPPPRPLAFPTAGSRQNGVNQPPCWQEEKEALRKEVIEGVKSEVKGVRAEVIEGVKTEVIEGVKTAVAEELRAFQLSTSSSLAGHPGCAREDSNVPMKCRPASSSRAASPSDSASAVQATPQFGQCGTENFRRDLSGDTPTREPGSRSDARTPERHCSPSTISNLEKTMERSLLSENSWVTTSPVPAAAEPPVALVADWEEAPPPETWHPVMVWAPQHRPVVPLSGASSSGDVMRGELRHDSVSPAAKSRDETSPQSYKYVVEKATSFLETHRLSDGPAQIIRPCAQTEDHSNSVSRGISVASDDSAILRKAPPAVSVTVAPVPGADLIRTSALMPQESPVESNSGSAVIREENDQKKEIIKLKTTVSFLQARNETLEKKNETLEERVATLEKVMREKI